MKRILFDSGALFTRIALTENGKLTEIIFEDRKKDNLIGNIYLGRVINILPGIKAAFVDIGTGQNGYMYYAEKGKAPKPGDIIPVQVTREASGRKGFSLSPKVSVPGKFIILIPEEERIGISQKIRLESERERIKEIISRILPPNYGIIIRTDGEGRTEDEFKAEILRLYKRCEEIMLKARYSSAPCLLHKDFSPAVKAVRELFTGDIDEFIINGKEEYDEACAVAEIFGYPKERIILYKEQEQLFTRYFIEGQIKEVFNPKVWLKSGGFLVIEQTEALVVIDVNTGKFTGKKTGNMILKTNLEAAEEIARQLRLRNLSGMIIIDFIDMKNEEDKKLLKRRLTDAVSRDRVKTIVVGMTELNLMQVTRKKVRVPVFECLSKKCTCCAGKGYILSLDFIASNIHREISEIFASTIFDEVVLSAGIPLIKAFAGEGNVLLSRAEERYNKSIVLNEDAGFGYGQYEIKRHKRQDCF